MGLFDFLKGKPAAPPPEIEPPAQVSREAPHESFMRALAERYQGARIVQDDGDEAELRTKASDVPVRLTLTDRGWVKIEARLENRVGTIDMTRDESKAPTSSTSDDPFSDEDKVRVALGQGVFVEGTRKEAERQTAVFAKLPEPFRARMLEQMQALSVTNIATYRDRLFLRTENVSALSSPVDVVQAAIGLACECARAFSAGTGPIVAENRFVISTPEALAARVQQLAQKHVKCTYCAGAFVLDENPTCPHCGAAYSGIE